MLVYIKFAIDARKAAGTLAEGWDRYVADRLSRHSPTTLGYYRDLWRVHIQKRFGCIPIVDISQAQVDQWHLDVTRTRGPYIANRAFEALPAAINWQIRRYRYALPSGFINPCYGVERNKERPFLAYYPMLLVHAPFVPTPAQHPKSPSPAHSAAPIPGPQSACCCECNPQSKKSDCSPP